MTANNITIGLDLGDRKHSASVLSASGEIRAEEAITNTRECLTAFASRHPGATFVMETGTHSPWVSRPLESLGYPVLVANAGSYRGVLPQVGGAGADDWGGPSIMGLDRVTIITLGSAIPPAVGIFGRLEGILRQPDTGLDEIVDLVRVDPALTFQIIRLGNSVFYGGQQRCESLEEAVARIGFGDIHSLVGLVAARQTCRSDLLAYQIPAQRFWENAVATGQIMAAFAQDNGTDALKAYSTGLLRNLGRIVLNDHGGAVRYPGEAVAPDLSAWEQTTYRTTAAEVGAVLLEHWRFSSDTIAALRAHLEPTVAADSAQSAAMLHLAAAVADGWGFGLPGECQRWRQNPAMLALAGLTEDGFARAAQAAREKFNRATEIKWANAA